jgi:hypothetical protein
VALQRGGDWLLYQFGVGSLPDVAGVNAYSIGSDLLLPHAMARSAYQAHDDELISGPPGRTCTQDTATVPRTWPPCRQAERGLGHVTQEVKYDDFVCVFCIWRAGATEHAWGWSDRVKPRSRVNRVPFLA